jgi:hypothetical protein
LHSYIIRLDLLKYPAQKKKLWNIKVYTSTKNFHFRSMHFHKNVNVSSLRINVW